jgi:hypothetical protein
VSYRWDGLALRHTPPVAALSPATREAVAAVTQLDRTLYMRALADHAARRCASNCFELFRIVSNSTSAAAASSCPRGGGGGGARGVWREETFLFSPQTNPLLSPPAAAASNSGTAPLRWAARWPRSKTSTAASEPRAPVR